MIKTVVPKWGKCKSGTYKPINGEKYNGEYPIIFRSGLEEAFMEIIDSTPSVLSWSSESFIVPYISPIDHRPHRYFPDFVLKILNNQNIEEWIIVEIKPDSQTRPPNMPRKKTPKRMNRYKKDLYQWLVNKEKWKAAKKIAKDKGAKFMIITEKWFKKRSL